jgi:hypothetical protein
MKLSGSSNRASATAIALLCLWSAETTSKNRECGNEFYYANDLEKQADASFASGDCRLGISQLHESGSEWKRISTLESCSAENRDAALANLAVNKRRIAVQSSSCPTYVEWRPIQSSPEKALICARELSAATESHLQAMSLARDRNCAKAVPLFESTERSLSELARRTTCSVEAHQTALSNMHRIRYDLSILRRRYCVDSVSK